MRSVPRSVRICLECDGVFQPIADWDNVCQSCAVDERDHEHESDGIGGPACILCGKVEW